MTEKDFYKNIELWSLSHPKEARLLPYANLEEIHVIKNEDGSLNLKCAEFNLYQKNPIEEASEWFKKLSLENVEVLFIYGLGLGYYFLPLKQWLEEKEGRQLIFIEDDLRIIGRFLETELATSLLKNSKIQICYLDTIEDKQGVLENLYWSTMLAKIKVEALQSYKHQKAQNFESLKYKIAYDSAMKNALVDEYLRFGASFYRNFYPNILDLHRSYWGNLLFHKFPKVPAIICGAGPSLEKQVKELNRFINKALIFTGGSSLNVLSAHGIQPHFGAGIDPNPAQYARLSSNQAYEVPFFYRNRMYAEAFQTIRGPRLYISGAGGYDTSEWFEEKFGLKSDFLDEGHNVINFCLEVAYRMGCNPIILIGMDLAFTGMKSYAKGVIDDAAITEKELLSSEEEDQKAILRTDIYGKPIYTLWKWVAESDFIANFAKSHPEITLVNATEGGIGFSGVVNESFAEASKRLLIESYDLKGWVHGEIQNAAIPQVTQEKLLEASEELKNSLKRSIEYLNILIEENKKLKSQKKLSEPLPVSGRAALSETELADEVGYRYVLDIFNGVYARVLNRRLTQIKKEKGVKLIKQKIELQIEKLQFLLNAAKANLALLNYALTGNFDEQN